MGRTVGAARRDLGEAALAQRERQEHGAPEPRHSAQAHRKSKPEKCPEPGGGAGRRRRGEGSRGTDLGVGRMVCRVDGPTWPFCSQRFCAVQRAATSLGDAGASRCSGAVASATPPNAPARARRRSQKHARSACAETPKKASKSPRRGTSTMRRPSSRAEDLGSIPHQKMQSRQSVARHSSSCVRVLIL